MWAMLITWVTAELMVMIARRELHLAKQLAKFKAAKGGIRALSNWLESQGGAMGKLATGMQSIVAAASLWGEGEEWAGEYYAPVTTAHELESWHTTVNGMVMTAMTMLPKWAGQYGNG